MTRGASPFACSLALLSLSTCTTHVEPKRADEQVEAAPTPTVPTPTPVVPVSEPPPPPPPAPPPPPLEAVPVTPVPGVVQWRELPGFDAIDALHPFVLGLLARDGYHTYKLTKDGVLEEIEVDVPDPIEADQGQLDEADVSVDVPGGLIEAEERGYARVWGEWRTDAWAVDLEIEGELEDEGGERGDVIWDVRFKLVRLRSDKWVAQKLNGHSWIVDSGQQLRKGWAGGFLIYDAPAFHRLPESSELPTPTLGHTHAVEVIDFFESRSGGLVLVSRDDDQRAWVQPRCDDAECVRTRAQALPEGAWDFLVDVPRGDDGLSVVAQPVGQGDKPLTLLHHDVVEGKHRFNLEQLTGVARLPEVMWPDKRGGLWLWLDDVLGHRDPKGRWFAVALPPACAEARRYAAIRLVPHEFVLLCVPADGPSIAFAAAGTVEAGTPPPVPEPAPAEAASEPVEPQGSASE